MKPVLMLVAAAGLVLLVAACSGPPTSAGAGGTPGTPGTPSATPSTAVAYSSCMRSHGVPRFPDPVSGGVVPKTSAQELGVSDARLQAAQAACRHQLPVATSFLPQARQCLTAGACSPALVQQILTADRAFARCMRSHHQTHSQPISGHLGECLRLDPAPAALESN